MGAPEFQPNPARLRSLLHHGIGLPERILPQSEPNLLIRKQFITGRDSVEYWKWLHQRLSFLIAYVGEEKLFFCPFMLYDWGLQIKMTKDRVIEKAYVWFLNLHKGIRKVKTQKDMVFTLRLESLYTVLKRVINYGEVTRHKGVWTLGAIYCGKVNMWEN